MCRTEKIKQYSKPKHVNAKPYKRDRNTNWEDYED